MSEIHNEIVDVNINFKYKIPDTNIEKVININKNGFKFTDIREKNLYNEIKKEETNINTDNINIYQGDKDLFKIIFDKYYVDKNELERIIYNSNNIDVNISNDNLEKLIDLIFINKNSDKVSNLYKEFNNLLISRIDFNRYYDIFNEKFTINTINYDNKNSNEYKQFLNYFWNYIFDNNINIDKDTVLSFKIIDIQNTKSIKQFNKIEYLQKLYKFFNNFDNNKISILIQSEKTEAAPSNYGLPAAPPAAVAPLESILLNDIVNINNYIKLKNLLYDKVKKDIINDLKYQITDAKLQINDKYKNFIKNKNINLYLFFLFNKQNLDNKDNIAHLIEYFNELEKNYNEWDLYENSSKISNYSNRNSIVQRPLNKYCEPSKYKKILLEYSKYFYTEEEYKEFKEINKNDNNLIFNKINNDKLLSKKIITYYNVLHLLNEIYIPSGTIIKTYLKNKFKNIEKYIKIKNILPIKLNSLHKQQFYNNSKINLYYSIDFEFINEFSKIEWYIDKIYKQSTINLDIPIKINNNIFLNKTETNTEISIESQSETNTKSESQTTKKISINNEQFIDNYILYNPYINYDQIINNYFKIATLFNLNTDNYNNLIYFFMNEKIFNYINDNFKLNKSYNTKKEIIEKLIKDLQFYINDIYFKKYNVLFINNKYYDIDTVKYVNYKNIKDEILINNLKTEETTEISPVTKSEETTNIIEETRIEDKTYDTDGIENEIEKEVKQIVKNYIKIEENKDIRLFDINPSTYKIYLRVYLNERIIPDKPLTLLQKFQLGEGCLTSASNIQYMLSQILGKQINFLTENLQLNRKEVFENEKEKYETNKKIKEEKQIKHEEKVKEIIENKKKSTNILSNDSQTETQTETLIDSKTETPNDSKTKTQTNTKSDVDVNNEKIIKGGIKHKYTNKKKKKKNETLKIKVINLSLI